MVSVWNPSVAGLYLASPQLLYRCQQLPKSSWNMFKVCDTLAVFEKACIVNSEAPTLLKGPVQVSTITSQNVHGLKDCNQLKANLLIPSRRLMTGAAETLAQMSQGSHFWQYERSNHFKKKKGLNSPKQN